MRKTIFLLLAALVGTATAQPASSRVYDSVPWKMLYAPLNDSGYPTQEVVYENTVEGIRKTIYNGKDYNDQTIVYYSFLNGHGMAYILVLDGIEDDFYIYKVRIVDSKIVGKVNLTALGFRGVEDQPFKYDAATDSVIICSTKTHYSEQKLFFIRLTGGLEELGSKEGENC